MESASVFWKSILVERKVPPIVRISTCPIVNLGYSLPQERVASVIWQRASRTRTHGGKPVPNEPWSTLSCQWRSGKLRLRVQLQLPSLFDFYEVPRSEFDGSSITDSAKPAESRSSDIDRHIFGGHRNLDARSTLELARSRTTTSIDSIEQARLSSSRGPEVSCRLPFCSLDPMIESRASELPGPRRRFSTLTTLDDLSTSLVKISYWSLAQLLGWRGALLFRPWWWIRAQVGEILRRGNPSRWQEQSASISRTAFDGSMMAKSTSSDDDQSAESCAKDLLSLKKAPLKLYCLLYGIGTGCLNAFLPVYYRKLGISAAQNGLLGALAPLVAFVSAPFWSGIADKRRIARGLLAVSLVIYIGTNLLKWIVPAATKCSFLTSNQSDVSFTNFSQEVTPSGPSFFETTPTQSDQLRVFLILVGIVLLSESFSAQACTLGLADTVILDLLGAQEGNYGNQRLWHAAGWGIGNLFSGWLANRYADECQNGNYTVHFVGFMCFTGLSALTVATLFKKEAEEAAIDKKNSRKRPFGVWRGLRKTFSNGEAVVFLAAVFVLAMLKAVVDNFLAWYVKELNGNELIIGASLLVMAVAELPMFAAAGWLISRLGHATSLCLVFFAYTVRFVAYANLTSPNYVLLIEPLHGVTFSLMWSTCVSYVKKVAPDDMQATMQGVLNGVFYGIGKTTGSLFGGFLYSVLGPRWMFAIEAIIAAVCGLLYTTYHWYRSRQKTPTTSQDHIPLVAMGDDSDYSASEEFEWPQ